MKRRSWRYSSKKESAYNANELFGKNKGRHLNRVDDESSQAATDTLTAREKMKQQRDSAKIYHDLLTDLKSCTVRKDLLLGRRIHAKAVESGNESNANVVTALIRMYGKCGSIVDARLVFDTVAKPNVVSWTVLLLGYAENGEGFIALELFSRMKTSGCEPDSVTYVAALKACTSLAVNGGKEDCLERGKEIHREIGYRLDHYVQNVLIDMYSKCGSMVDARRTFDGMRMPDVVSWTALLLGYAGNGEGLTALDLFSRMKARGCVPDTIAYVAALKACKSLAVNGDYNGKRDVLEWGRRIHTEVGCHLNRYLQSTLIEMYAKFGSMVEARRVFDAIQNPDVVSWTALLLGYAENGDGLAGLELFSKMKACGCPADAVTYVAALMACTSLAANRVACGKEVCLERGRVIHSEIGQHLNHYMRNTLIDMYSKCGSMFEARRVFDSIQNPDVVSWTALLLGYVENADGYTALALFRSMKGARGCAPNSMTYVGALKACGLVGALSLGRKFHSDISDFTPHVVTCLVDFYAKCGSMVEACDVFDLHSKARVVPTWNALLAGYGSFGETAVVFNLFEVMQDQGFQPDAITFVCLLSCCSHAGLVEKAREYFEAMETQYGIIPTVMHYTCMVDVQGRANQLKEAITTLQKMPYDPTLVTWMTILGACRKWKNVDIGRWAFHALVDLDKKNAPAHILMAHIYGSRGMWEEQERVLETIGNWKLSEEAYVTDELGKKVKFVVGEEDPPEFKDRLEQLHEGMKAYVAESYNFSFNANSEALCGHSERRAVVYGLLKTSADEPVRTFKNMRMCDLCHKSTKTISEICGRVIIVKDSSKFHVMANGICSCRDYW